MDYEDVRGLVLVCYVAGLSGGLFIAAILYQHPGLFPIELNEIYTVVGYVLLAVSLLLQA